MKKYHDWMDVCVVCIEAGVMLFTFSHIFLASSFHTSKVYLSSSHVFVVIPSHPSPFTKPQQPFSTRLFHPTPQSQPRR